MSSMRISLKIYGVCCLLFEFYCFNRARETVYEILFFSSLYPGFLSCYVTFLLLLLLLHQVWSLVRRFDQPQKYKPFVSRCIVQGDPEIGSVREVNVKTGLPATTSTEQLEQLDDNEHILRVKILGGDHRLRVLHFSLFFL